MVEKEQILRLMRSHRYSSITADELARSMHLRSGQRGELLAALRELELEGRLVGLKEQRWVDPARVEMVVGRLQCNPGGFGFVIPLQEGGQDLYVAEEQMGQAMHGDLVAVELLHRQQGRGRRGVKLGPAGRVVKVIDHATERLIGTYQPGGKFARVVPDDPRLFRDIYVVLKGKGAAKEGEKVLVRITEWPSLHRNPEGEVIEVLGREGDPGVDVLSVIHQFNLPDRFPQPVLQAAKDVSAHPPGQRDMRREDFRNQPTVTIDPENAKDFDDALSFYRDEERGRAVVLVHIADVSFFVPPESVLDMEARKRGLSVYLASDVVPMLPEEQSRDVFSLVEGEDRPAKTVVLEFDDRGAVVDHSLCHSLVHVDRRMSYREVQAILEATDAEDELAGAAAARQVPEQILNLLCGLDGLARQVGARRRRIGSIDLDVPEYDVGVDEEGRAVSVTQIVRDRSHGLVEEFMLSANVAVANFLKAHRLPGLFRTHEKPDEEDLGEFAEFVQSVMQREVDALDRKQLQSLLADVSGTHLAEAVNMQLLRAMKRATYTPKCAPHFALHFDRYCHFTSPVRRYPDLVVHQILDEHLLQGVAPGRLRARWNKRLPGLAEHCNLAQQRADEAEREIIKIKLLRFLQDRTDEIFDAIITGVQEYGLFVQLQLYSVEGLIKVKDMKDDFYRFSERAHALVGTRTRKRFSLGQRLKVALKEVDTARREADFLLYE